jgi:hypothetical protein
MVRLHKKSTVQRAGYRVGLPNEEAMGQMPREAVAL